MRQRYRDGAGGEARGDPGTHADKGASQRPCSLPVRKGLDPAVEP